MSMRSLRERLPRKFPIGIQNCFVEGIPADLLFYPFPPAYVPIRNSNDVDSALFSWITAISRYKN
jgi:hypothetical protein